MYFLRISFLQAKATKAKSKAKAQTDSETDKQIADSETADAAPAAKATPKVRPLNYKSAIPELCLLFFV